MPQHFQHYTIATPIEMRTASATYLASHDNQPTQMVVLKLFHKPTFDNPAEQETFLLESDKLSHINHPHIVPLLETGIAEEQAYIVSEYMPSGSLRVRLDRSYPRQMALQQAITIISQIGQALTYLHARYLIHGQLKPEHILFDAKGSALLSDPYCSTRPAPWDANNENASDVFRYLAPEQFAHESNALSDQYALCCVAYELLTGRPPFTLRDPQELAEQQKHVVPTPPGQLVSDLPIAIEQAILKGLEKDPDQRHKDIVALLGALSISKQASIAIPNLPLPRSKRQTASLVPTRPTAQPQPSKTATDLHTEMDTLQLTSELSATNISIDRPTSASTLQDNADGDLQIATTELAPLSVISASDADVDQLAPLSVTSASEAEDEFSKMNIQDDPAETLEELLQGMALEEELLIATNENPALSRPVELYDTVSQEFAPASTALEDVAIPATSTQTAPTGRAGISQQETIALASTSPFSQLLSRQGRKNAASATTARSFTFRQAGRQNWLSISKRTTTTIVWALVIILIVGSLITYTALASTAPKSSSLALLSATSTFHPTPQPTVDQLGILPQSTSTDTHKEPKPTSKPTPKPTSKPTPKSQSQPALMPTATPINMSIPGLVPTATPIHVSTPKPTATPPIIYQPLPGTWTQCAVENATCTFSGTMAVAFGVNGSFSYATKSNGTACTSAIFGDPLYGTPKTCYIEVTPPGTSVWAPCAGENSTCSFLGTMTVAFGVNGSYNYATKTNGTSCTAGTFGDPAPGSVKSCYLMAPPAYTAIWSSCAPENGTCSFSGRREVAYGVQGQYFYGIFTNSTPCNNNVFGDPAFWAVKACYYQ